VLVSGQREGKAAKADFEVAVDQMRVLNRAASEVLVREGVRAATDITGFGLLGHALEMARAGGVRFAFDARSLPVLPGVLELARAGVETGGAAHNRRFVAPSLTVGSVAPEAVAIAHDPQTSGGLLASVPLDLVARVDAGLAESGVERWWIGRVEAGEGVALV
jgi:selenide,water dikinase